MLFMVLLTASLPNNAIMPDEVKSEILVVGYITTKSANQIPVVGYKKTESVFNSVFL